MAEIVEGDWNDYTFKMIKQEDYPEVFEHMENNFYLDEPLMKLLGPSEPRNEDINLLIGMIMDQNMSFCVRDKATGKIAAVRIMGESKKGESLEQFAHLFKSEDCKLFLPLMMAWDKEGNLFERYGLDVYMDLFMMSVDRAHRRKGIADECYRRAILLGQSKGYKMTKSYFSSPYTQRIARNRNFDEIFVKIIKDEKNEEGEQLFKNAVDETCALMAKRI